MNVLIYKIIQFTYQQYSGLLSILSCAVQNMAKNNGNSAAQMSGGTEEGNICIPKIKNKKKEKVQVGYINHSYRKTNRSVAFDSAPKF